jgi:hypothetical protein
VNTAIAITAIIAAVLVINIIATTLRDIGKAKHQPTPCPNCTDKNKENEA